MAARQVDTTLPKDVPTQLLIGGKWRAAHGNQTLAVSDPATEQVVAEVADGSVEDAQVALEAAVAAFAGFKKTSAYQRSRWLRSWFEAIRSHRDPLARLITIENGKPLTEALGEVDYAASFVEWFSEEAKRVYGRTIPATTTDRRLLAIRQPVGVVAAITPWNFPAAMITRKLAPALAAGCTVVLKPASLTPLTALYLAKLWQEAGGPDGTLNVITTSQASAVADAWMSDQRLRKVTFTGSTPIGQELIRKSAAQVQRLSLELGGQAPFVVFDDADLDLTIAAMLVSKFRNGGQSCVASNRMLVQRNILAAFTERATAATAALRIGHGLTPGVEIGPLIDRSGQQKVLAHIADALAKGAQVQTGGRALDGSGFFVQPTVLSGVQPGMRVMEEETFGPVVAISAFDTEEQGVALANASPFGLAAYAFTASAGRAWRVAEGLEYGIVGLNEGLPSTAQAPFGGWKLSGIGREGASEGLDAFLEEKYIAWGGIDG
ncbi:MAG: NAD-dependent succinate-semialdehyde dehydrogenase [Sulfobacillus sp.]